MTAVNEVVCAPVLDDQQDRWHSGRYMQLVDMPINVNINMLWFCTRWWLLTLLRCFVWSLLFTDLLCSTYIWMGCTSCVPLIHKLWQKNQLIANTYLVFLKKVSENLCKTYSTSTIVPRINCFPCTSIESKQNIVCYKMGQMLLLLYFRSLVKRWRKYT